jgi:hypothetical protein
MRFIPDPRFVPSWIPHPDLFIPDPRSGIPNNNKKMKAKSLFVDSPFFVAINSTKFKIIKVFNRYFGIFDTID